MVSLLIHSSANWLKIYLGKVWEKIQHIAPTLFHV